MISRECQGVKVSASWPILALRRRAGGGCIAVAILGFWALAAAGAPRSQIELTDGWARATPPGISVGAAYLTIVNIGATTDRLVGLDTPIAASVEMHASSEAHGVMQMRRIDHLDCPAGKRIVVAPGGIHFMLIGLRRALAPGESFALTLHFAQAGERTITVPVRAAT